MSVPHALSFPRLCAPDGLIGAGPQTTAWLYMAWHAGFPLAVIGIGRTYECNDIEAAGPAALQPVEPRPGVVVERTLDVTRHHCSRPDGR